jgi:putative DNA primase/helicase
MMTASEDREFRSLVGELPLLEQIGAVGDFFDGTTFVAPRLAEYLRSRWPTATGGRRLYAFADGSYTPAEDFLRREIVSLLGSQWRTKRADEALSYLQQSSEPLWDTPPRDRIAVANGILTLATRQLSPASPDFRSPVRISAIYDPAAACPAIERFLHEVFPDGANLLYEVIGHLMVPENRQRAFMFLGGGGNGKSTVLRLLNEFLGPQNISSVSLHALEDNRFAAADLYGKLANVYADLDARALNATGVFKSITGGDPIRAEHKHRDAFSFIATARLVFSANEAPPTHDSSQAFFDRWIIVPFNQRLRGSKQERQQDDLLAELTTPRELSGLLNRALDGLERLRQTGRFTLNDATQHAGEEFRAAADSVAGFIADRCTIEPTAQATRSQLWSAYRDWCTNNNRRPVSSQRFHSRLRELAQFTEDNETKHDGIRGYAGIRLEEQ